MNRVTTRAVASLLAVLLAMPAAAADLQPRTIAAFDRYVRATEARMAQERAFIILDAMPESRRRSAAEELRNGGQIIERLTARDQGREIDVPDGLIHHWVGLAFVPGASVEDAVALLQDYDAHDEVYAPTVARSALRGRNGEELHAFLRFSLKKVITVVVNSEHTARFTRPASDRAEGRVVSTRIAEVENPGTPQEREKPVGHDGGYLWRINSYWRLLARDGGVYIQCESISLTRGIPTGFGWLVGPFVTSIPRESLAFTMEKTREYLAAKKTRSGTG